MMMLSIDREADRHRKRAACIQTLLLWGLSLFALSIAFGVLLFLLLTHAAASSVCLTKSEARQLWPKRHIYWYGPHHCWSNRRGPPTGIKVDPVRNSLAESLPATPYEKPATENHAGKADRAATNPRTIRPTIFYPPLNMRGSVPPEMLRAYAATQWPLLLDVDEEDDPELGVTKDGCCWPKLKDLIGERTKPLENHIGAQK